MKNKFQVPFMVLYREDVITAIGTERADKMSDKQMQQLAGKIGNILCSDWDSMIRNILG